MKNLLGRSGSCAAVAGLLASCQHPQVRYHQKISRSFVTAFSPTRSSPSAMRPRVVSVQGWSSTSPSQDDVHDDRWRPSGSNKSGESTSSSRVRSHSKSTARLSTANGRATRVARPGTPLCKVSFSSYPAAGSGAGRTSITTEVSASDSLTSPYALGRHVAFGRGGGELRPGPLHPRWSRGWLQLGSSLNDIKLTTMRWRRYSTPDHAVVTSKRWRAVGALELGGDCSA